MKVTLIHCDVLSKQNCRLASYSVYFDKSSLQILWPIWHADFSLMCSCSQVRADALRANIAQLRLSELCAHLCAETAPGGRYFRALIGADPSHLH